MNINRREANSRVQFDYAAAEWTRGLRGDSDVHPANIWRDIAPDGRLRRSTRGGQARASGQAIARQLVPGLALTAPPPIKVFPFMSQTEA